MNKQSLNIEDRLKNFKDNNLLIDKNNKVYKYSDLLAEISIFKTAFKKASLKENDSICVLLPNSLNFITSLVTSSSLNLCFIPFKGSYKENLNAIEYISPHFFLVNKKELENFKENESFKIKSDIYLVKSLKSKFNKSNISFIRMTSGTTGEPKAVMIKEKSALARINTAQKILNINEHDTIGWPMDMAYHFIVSIILYLFNGACIKLIDLNDKTIIKQELSELTKLYASPKEISFILEHLENTPNSLKEIYSTAYNLNSKIIEKFIQKFNIKLIQIYGMIEIGLPFYCKYEKKVEEYWGSVAPDFSFKLKPLSEINTENIGSLLVRGPGLFDGYLNSKIEEDTYFDTGDIAKVNSDLKLKILGRKKSAFFIEDRLIVPEVVEAKINSEFNLIDSLVFKKENNLFINYISQNNKFKENLLIKFTKSFLSITKTNVSVLKVLNLEKTKTGKIKRN